MRYAGDQANDEIQKGEDCWAQWVDSSNNELVVEYFRELADGDIDWQQMVVYFQPEEDDPAAHPQPGQDRDVQGDEDDMSHDGTADENEPAVDLSDAIYDEPFEKVALEDYIFGIVCR